jgi:outer membrane PBP1 activator LpoA protein
MVFYDTAGTPAGAVTAYQKAIAEGADYVLGPLGRDEVTAVFRDVQVTVPLLALNRGTAAPPSGSTSFSLAPEDDGIAAAEYLLARQLRRVLVIQGTDDGMRRSSGALREQLQSRGGTVVEVVTLGEAPADALPALQAAASKEGGIDAVFFALRGAQARALAPTLAAAGLAGKPRVATSQITSGTGKPEEDRLLDGIAFPTEAWSVRPVTGLPDATQAGAQLSTARGPAAKLFAFGYDAWLLTAYLERLALQPNARIDGATGTLRLDGFGNVLRTPAWSTFGNGAVVPLPRGGD